MSNLDTKVLSPYERDCKHLIRINDKIGTKGWYNLVVSIRDVKLWKAGIRPNRFWKLKQVKEYFQVKGNTDKILTQLETMLEEYNSGKTNLTNLTD